ncbi:MAG: hypothetical protein ACTHMF_18175, partial [Leifsonia sp.]
MTRIDERTVPRSPLARGAAGDERDALSRARLDLGFNVATVALIAFLLVLFFLDIGDYPLLGLTIAAWVLVAVTLVAALVLRFRLPDELPLWLYLGGLGMWAVALALDIAGSWPGGGAAAPLTAAAAIGPALLLCVPVRPARDILLAAAALGGVLAI